MECSQVRAILFENADTDLPEEVKERVDAHLAGCPSCARQLEALRDQMQALRSMPKMEAPRGFLDEVRLRVDRPSGLRGLGERLSAFFGARHFLRLAGAVATAVLVFVTVQTVLREDGRQKSQIAPVSPPLEAPRDILRGSVSPQDRVVKRDRQASNQAAAPPSESRRTPAPARGIEAPHPSVALTLRVPGGVADEKARSRAFGAKPAPASRASAGGAQETKGEMERPHERGDPRLSQEAAGSGPQPEGGGDVVSQVKRLVLRANGRILSDSPAGVEGRPATLLAEIPTAGYRAFIDRLREMGELKLDGGEGPGPSPDTKVRVAVTFLNP